LVLLQAELVRIVPDAREREVVIYKRSGDPLGISIRGGAEHNLPILLSDIAEGGPAASTRGFFVGDEVLAVSSARWECGLQGAKTDSLLRGVGGNRRVLAGHVLGLPW